MLEYVSSFCSVGVLPQGAASQWPNRDCAATTDIRAGLSALDLGVWWGRGPPMGPPHLDPAKGQGFSCLRPVQTRVIKGDTLFNSSVTGFGFCFCFFCCYSAFQSVRFSYAPFFYCRQSGDEVAN